MLKEAKRLYDVGFAIHWLKANSKMPVESKWTTGPRKPWGYLKETYISGLNVGVRLGETSKIRDHYLGVIDCDVKSKDKKHLKEMNEKLKSVINVAAPIVLSGRGNGSKHIYVLTKEVSSTHRIAQSPEKVKVSMPSVKPSKFELEILSSEEIDQGIRLRAAWEISFMGQGSQVVLPPSIHPDSKKPYLWDLHIKTGEELPIVNIGKSTKDKIADKVQEDFEPVLVDLIGSNLSSKIVDGIISGKDVEDRSAFLMSAALAMISNDFSDQEIMSVLTDSETFLGRAAFEHSKTESRKKAASWIKKYTIDKARKEFDYKSQFEVVDLDKFHEKVLSPEEIERQEGELEPKEHWGAKLQRPQNGGNPKSNFHNIKLILENISPDGFIKFNEFTRVEFWGSDTLWGSKAGSSVSDMDLINIKDYLVHHFGMECSTNIISEVVAQLANQNKFHPVRDFLDTLEWDGKPRLDTWLKDYFGAEAPEPYLSCISRKTIVAMVKRIYEPGCDLHTVLIMEGGQGIGKSSTARILSHPWFSDSHLNIGDKDAVMNMQGVWVYELGELSAMSRADANQLKEFLSRAVDKMRPPYGKKTQEYPRQSVFIGTTNNDEYLKDKTGNRRFWPVRVEQLKFKELERDRDQLLAEAKFAYELGETLYLDNAEAISQAKEETRDRQESDVWTELLADFLDQNQDNFNVNKFTMKELTEWGPNEVRRSDLQSLRRIGSSLREIGYKKVKARRNKVLVWLWERDLKDKSFW